MKPIESIISRILHGAYPKYYLQIQFNQMIQILAEICGRYFSLLLNDQQEVQEIKLLTTITIIQKYTITCYGKINNI